MDNPLIILGCGYIGNRLARAALAAGRRVRACARGVARLEPLRALGAAELLLLDDELPARVRELTGGRGADLVLDLVGGEHLPRLLAALAPRGRLVLVGLTAGRRAELDLGLILTRRLRLVGSVLRPRPRAEKAALVAAFAAFALPRLAAGRLRPLIDRVFPLAEVAAAYAALEAGGVVGKIVLDLTTDGAGISRQGEVRTPVEQRPGSRQESLARIEERWRRLPKATAGEISAWVTRDRE